MMKVAIGCDHGGFELKKQVVKHLADQGYELTDVGCNSLDSVDYPVYAKKVCDLVNNGDVELGILICGTGIGMSMAANKIKGIRAALLSDCFSAEKTREHNNANVMCLGGRVIGPELAFRIVDTFLTTPFSNAERHQRRVNMLEG